NKHVKLVVDPSRTERFTQSSAHSAVYVGGVTAVNEQGVPVIGNFSRPPTISRLRVNHYWTKSVEEFFRKKVGRGDVNLADKRATARLRDVDGLLEAERNYGTGDDVEIQRFVPQVKRAMSRAPVLDTT